MLTIRRAHPRDARFIAERMWERGAAELRKCGLDDRKAIQERLRLYSQTPLSFAMFDGDEPIAFFGALRMAPEYYRTWFQATDAFVSHGMASTKQLKKFLAAQVVNYPGAVLDLVTASEHPAADKWFRLLGFRPIGEVEGHKCYRYNVEFVESQHPTL